MKSILLLTLLLSAAGTGNKYSMQQLAGSYYDKTTDCRRVLLKKDGTFIYKQWCIEWMNECKGKWSINNKNEVQAHCAYSDSSIEDILGTRILRNDSFSFEIVSPDSLRFDGLYFTRE